MIICYILSGDWGFGGIFAAFGGGVVELPT